MTTNLTRLTDSGFILECAGVAVAFDVGEYCDAALLAERQLNAAVFSHVHSDHCDVTKLPTCEITMAGPSDAEDTVRSAGATDYIALTPGGPVDIHGFTVEAVIVDHGKISMPIENYGLVITTPTNDRIWFAGDIRVDSEQRPLGRFDLIVVPVGGEYVLDADEAFTYVLTFPGDVVALGVHYDYAPEQAVRFAGKTSERVRPIILAPGLTVTIGGI